MDYAKEHMSHKASDLETMLGDPKKAIRSMIVAFFLAFAVVQVNQFVDTFWVSGLGNISSSAVSTTAPIYELLMCAGLGMGAGVTASISFHLGRGETSYVNRLAGNSLILGVVFAAVGSTLVALLGDPVLELMGAHDIIDECMAYLWPYIILSPFLLCETIVGSMLRGEGAAKKATVVQVTAAVFNMVIDPILIYVLDMGVAGAGLATCVSAALSMGIGLYWYHAGRTVVKLNRDAFRWNRDAATDVMDIGGPKTIQSAISSITDLIQRVFLIATGGTNAVMYYNYAWRYIGLAQLPGKAYESAMIPVCSAGYGQGDLEKMKEGFRYSAKMTILFSTGLGALMLIFADPLMMIMTYEESMTELRPTFVWTLQVSVVLIPFSALMGIGSSMLQTMKKAEISLRFYMLWGFIKLAMYAISAYALDSFEWIIYSMVIFHIFGGVALMLMARKEFSSLKTQIEVDRAFGLRSQIRCSIETSVIPTTLTRLMMAASPAGSTARPPCQRNHATRTYFQTGQQRHISSQARCSTRCRRASSRHQDPIA